MRFIGEKGIYSESSRGRLLVAEISNPSPAMDHVIGKFMRPQKETLASIVKELLGPEGEDPWKLQCCIRSIGAQCLHYAYAKPIIARLVPVTGSPEEQVEKLAAHIADFSLGGIRAIRELKETP
jgi:hypothetical protein